MLDKKGHVIVREYGIKSNNEIKGRTRETYLTTTYLYKLKTVQLSKLELCHLHMLNKLSDLSKLERGSPKSQTAK